MNNIPVVKLGIAAVSRDCFPMSLSEQRCEAVVKAAKDKGLDIFKCPTTIERETQMMQALKELKDAGIKVAMVTNTPHIRALWFSRTFGVKFHAYAKKPLPLGLIRMSRKLKVPLEKIGRVGDQVFTDVAAANRCGAVPLLVDPVENKWFWKNHYKKNRIKEAPIREAFIKEHGYYGENK